MAIHAQVRVFAGSVHTFDRLVLRLDNNRTLPPFSSHINDAYYTVLGARIMHGAMGSEFDLAYTWREGKLYRGDAFFSSNIVYSFDGERVYRGDSNFLIDVLYTVKNGIVYNGPNTTPHDALLMIQGRVSPPQLLAILLSLELISP
jgi:hypothetical protein